MTRIPVSLALAGLLAGCGGTGEGPPLGEFPAMSKKETDAAFVLAAPSSRSPAAFVYTSSNTGVATVDGATVTIVGPGETTIAASQPGVGSYGPTHTSAVLTVSSVCVPPATLKNNACNAPASSATAATESGRIWARVVHTDTWTHARDFCSTSVIDSVAGWRLPTRIELAELVASGAIAGHGWSSGSAWSSTASGSSNSAHTVVDLATGAGGRAGGYGDGLRQLRALNPIVARNPTVVPVILPSSQRRRGPILRLRSQYS